VNVQRATDNKHQHNSGPTDEGFTVRPNNNGWR
jgi:hypothetical protein